MKREVAEKRPAVWRLHHEKPKNAPPPLAVFAASPLGRPFAVVGKALAIAAIRTRITGVLIYPAVAPS